MEGNRVWKTSCGSSVSKNGTWIGGGLEVANLHTSIDQGQENMQASSALGAVRASVLRTTGAMPSPAGIQVEIRVGTRLKFYHPARRQRYRFLFINTFRPYAGCRLLAFKTAAGRPVRAGSARMLV
jgi:hypothetical protein